MVFGRRLSGDYPTAARFETGWRTLVNHLQGEEKVVGQSVQGRPLYRFDLGTRGAPVVFLSALIHGVEVIGSVALFHILQNLGKTNIGRKLLDELHIVVMPVLNPDAFALNMDRLDRGWPAMRRTNAHGVDLNRNFPQVAPIEKTHLFSGSRWRRSPYYQGTSPFSEPETQTVQRVVNDTRPALSLGFHSFGNLLLYPWAFSSQRNLREPTYNHLANAFLGDVRDASYTLKQASMFYPTVGDLDDWMDHAHGTLAMTVEVGGLNRRLWHPLRLLNPFCWMNPLRIESTVGALVPAIQSMLCNVGKLSKPVCVPVAG